MNFLPKVREIQAVRDSLNAIRIDDVNGRSLAESIYVLRDIAKTAETLERGDSKRGIASARERLKEESPALDGVYEFQAVERKTFDKEKFFILLSERFEIPRLQIDALIAECSLKQTTESLRFSRGYTV